VCVCVCVSVGVRLWAKVVHLYELEVAKA
jgi:hypothetical protein